MAKSLLILRITRRQRNKILHCVMVFYRGGGVRSRLETYYTGRVFSARPQYTYLNNMIHIILYIYM